MDEKLLYVVRAEVDAAYQRMSTYDDALMLQNVLLANHDKVDVSLDPALLRDALLEKAREYEDLAEEAMEHGRKLHFWQSNSAVEALISFGWSVGILTAVDRKAFNARVLVREERMGLRGMSI